MITRKNFLKSISGICAGALGVGTSRRVAAEVKSRTLTGYVFTQPLPPAPGEWKRGQFWIDTSKIYEASGCCQTWLKTVDDDNSNRCALPQLFTDEVLS